MGRAGPGAEEKDGGGRGGGGGKGGGLMERFSVGKGTRGAEGGSKGAGGRCERGGERGRDVALDLTSDCRLPSQRAGMRLRQGEKML